MGVGPYLIISIHLFIWSYDFSVTIFVYGILCWLNYGCQTISRWNVLDCSEWPSWLVIGSYMPEIYWGFFIWERTPLAPSFVVDTAHLQRTSQGTISREDQIPGHWAVERRPKMAACFRSNSRDQVHCLWEGLFTSGEEPSSNNGQTGWNPRLQDNWEKA